MSNKKFIKKGFGLIEALIASGILVMVAATTVGLTTAIVRNTVNFDDQIVAAYLAQEIIESAHFERAKDLNDGNKLSETDWNTSLLACQTNPHCSQIGLTTFRIPPSNTVEVNGKKFVIEPWIKSDVSKGPADPSPVTDNENEIEITVRVKLDGKTLSLAKSVLTNWKEPK